MRPGHGGAPAHSGREMSRGAIEGPFTGRDGWIPSSPRVTHRELPLPGRIGRQGFPGVLCLQRTALGRSQ